MKKFEIIEEGILSANELSELTGGCFIQACGAKGCGVDGVCGVDNICGANACGGKAGLNGASIF